MKNNIIKFPKKGNVLHNDHLWFCGYAAALADCIRNNGLCDDVLLQSGISIDQLRKYGADEYDLEELEGLV